MVGETDLTEFSGVAGRVLLRSVSAASLITGITVGFALIAGNGILVLADTPALTTPFTQIVLALALARFAVNGVFGEWSGTIFSSRGGPWIQVTHVALRYLALTAIWMLPMFWLGMGLEEDAAASMSLANGKLIGFALVYLLAMSLTPPLFLIVSVSARSFADVFSPDHWKALFGGRLGDLFVIYVVYTGTLGMVMILSLPPVAAAFGVNGKFGILIAALSFCMLFGVSVNLLGRLAGFYACGELDSAAPADPMEAMPHAPATGPTPPDSLEASPAGPQPDADLPAPTIPLTPVPASTSSAQTQMLPVQPADAPTGTQPAVGAAPASPEPGTGAASHAKLPPLLDGKERVEAELRRFVGDPNGALSALRDLYDSFAPHPHVMQALVLCLYRTNEHEAAVELATRAFPLCLDRGHAKHAAEMFTELKRHIEELGLNREQILMIAGTLARQDDLGTAATAYSNVIGRDPGEQRAIKGLLQVADRVLHERANPAAAARVYRYLLQHCATSPLVEFMNEGLAEAERKLSATPEPVGS